MEPLTKASGHETPAISVIMATLNNASCLPAAFASIGSQKDVDLECIVVDGGSTDGTVEIIKDHADIISHWLSEKDHGIADAFNKGLQIARGLLIYFMGADDVLHDDRVLADVVRELPGLKRPYFFYGDIIYSYSKGKKLIHHNFSEEKFRKYNCLPHQAMFLERSFFEKFGLFDARYRYAMDYEHISRFIESHKPQYIKRTIAEMRRYGRSSDILPTHEEMDTIRLSKGYAGRREILVDRVVLRMKMLVAQVFGLNW